MQMLRHGVATRYAFDTDDAGGCARTAVNR